MANNKKNREVRISKEVKDFAKATLKKYKKQSGDYYDSKKELKAAYYGYLIDLLPDTIEFLVKYGYIQKEEVQEVKHGALANINDPDFIKAVKKELKNDNKIKNIKLLPIIIKEILQEAKKANDAKLAEDPNAAIYDMSDLIELSQMILKKKMKKLMKIDGVQSTLAFDLLSIIPTEEVLSTSAGFRIRMMFECLYEHAKMDDKIPFKEIIEEFLKKEYHAACITFALLERKERFSKLTDKQKELYIAITSWCFDAMEHKCNKDEVENIIKTYIGSRKRDEAQGKDSNRRYALSSLSEEDYPRIKKVINRMISDDDTIKKYL